MTIPPRSNYQQPDTKMNTFYVGGMIFRVEEDNIVVNRQHSNVRYVIPKPAFIEFTTRLIAEQITDELNTDRGAAIAEIVDQLNWRGPNDKPLAHVVLPRELAESLV